MRRVPAFFEKIFRSLIGQPCWGVQPGYGSFLTMEFGEPHLEIREPAEVQADVSKRVRKLLGQRAVIVRGEWHLWIYCCQWRVFQDSKLIGDSSSRQKMCAAATALQGQRLVSVEVVPRGCRSIFEFDLGARLETRPYNRTGEQWMLFEPSGKVLVLRADKKYSYQKAHIPPDRQVWKAIGE